MTLIGLNYRIFRRQTLKKNLLGHAACGNNLSGREGQCCARLGRSCVPRIAMPGWSQPSPPHRPKSLKYRVIRRATRFEAMEHASFAGAIDPLVSHLTAILRVRVSTHRLRLVNRV